MVRVLSGPEWAAAVRDFEHTAFRLELQPAYAEAEEDPLLEAWLEGDRTPPIYDAASIEWLSYIRRAVALGKRIERVRVHDEPATRYQQWLRWMSRWSIEAGEQIRYMTRQRADEVGLLAAAGSEDWWLLDSSRLLVMRFTPDGRRIENELITDPARVVKACLWRDLAFHHSVPDTVPEHAA
jgi:hypothetical protein